MIATQMSLAVFIGLGILLPFLVDLVTKKLASGAVKSSVLLALSLIAGVLTEFLGALTADRPFDWSTAGYGAVTAFITGVAAFFGFLSPFGISGSSGIIQAAVPAGIGTAAVPPIESTQE